MRLNSLKANAVLNMIRKGSAILFPIITFSYASHKLGAARLGAYTFANSVISYLLLVAALGIATYAVREGQTYRDDDNKLKEFISQVYTINFLMTIVSYAILGALLLFWKKLSGYSEIVLILSVSIILTTLGADWINTLLEDYLFITIRFIVVQIFCLVMLITLVKEPDDIYKYAFIGMLSSAGGNILNIIHIRRRIRFHLTLKPNFRKHIVPMVTLFSNNLAIKIYLLADVTILGVFMEDQYVAYYSAASKVYTSVKELINALILVTVPRFSYYIIHGNNSAYEESYQSVFDGVSTLILPSVVGLLYQAENILFFLGGDENYVNGAGALRILSFSMIFAVIACLFAQSILLPYKQDKLFLRATVVSAVVNIVLNIILIPLFGIEAAALTTLLSEIIVCTMCYCYGKRHFDKVLSFSHDVKTAIVGSVAIAAVCTIIKYQTEARLLNMFLSIIISCLVYFVITYAMNNRIVRKGVTNVLGRFRK